jgi:hypothetical protein
LYISLKNISPLLTPWRVAVKYCHFLGRHVTGPDQGFLVSRLVLKLKPWERGWLYSLLRTKLPIDLPKHMSALLKTRSKQDWQTIKHHLTLLKSGTLLNLANTCWNWKIETSIIQSNGNYWNELSLITVLQIDVICELWEKYFIICKPKMATLNKCNELVSACRHNKKFLLSTVTFKVLLQRIFRPSFF